MTIAMPMRPPEPLAGPERAQLDGWLDYHRATLLTTCAGLDLADLTRRAIPSSTLSLLGLLQHMTSVEVNWCEVVLHGRDTPFPYTHDPAGTRERDSEFHDFTFASPEAVARRFDEVCARSRELCADLPLDTLAPRPGREGPVDLRWIYLHLIEEYARHNGHADLLREALDATRGR